MKRDIYHKLLAWKSLLRRKPLILKGARQTGKTFILQEFGKAEYTDVHYFNFEEDQNLSQFFYLNEIWIFCLSKPNQELIQEVRV